MAGELQNNAPSGSRLSTPDFLTPGGAGLTCNPYAEESMRSGSHPVKSPLHLPISVLVLCMAVLFATDAIAQHATAKIVGTITDPSGAVVPDVKVTVTNTATNVVSERHQTSLPRILLVYR